MQDPDNNKKISSDLVEILQTTELFSEIHEEVAEALIKRLKHVELSPGQILFQEGSKSNAFYIVVEGQLVAYLKTTDGKEKMIGAIEKGETVGEMGALSEQPRSLSVKATVETKLLELNREEFELFSKDHPQILMNMINYIITRSQNTIKLLSEKKLYKHIAIIQGNSKTPLKHFIHQIKKYLRPQKQLIWLENSASNLSKEIIQAEKSGKMLVFFLNKENLSTLLAKINHIGEIYLVVDGEGPAEFSEFALQMARGHHNPLATSVRLILLHRDTTVIPKDTIAWLSQADFNMHYHLRDNNISDYQRLVRFIAGKPFGVVLGGGGGKGWACIGALKALIDCNVPIDAIGGTSVGALIAACYAHRLNYDELFKDFKKLSEAADKPFSLKNLTWPLISLLSSKHPTEQLIKTFGEVQIEDLWIPFFSVATNLNKGKEAIHQTGTLWERLRASMALPGIVPPVVLDGQVYVDGGLMNNLPVDIMRNLLGKEAIIIAVSLSKLGEDKKRYYFPPIIPFHVGLLKRLGWGYKDYKLPPFFNTFLASLLVGSSSKEKANKLMANTIITPDLSSYRTLKVDIQQSDKILQIGYISTKEIVKNEVLNWLNPLND